MSAHLLIVDDEEGSRDALAFALERNNRLWTISTASSVEEAGELIDSPPAERGPVDVILTDLNMGQYHPEGGIEVLELAKKKDPFIMVLLFTAQEKRIDRGELFRDGAFDCIEKNIVGRAAWQEIESKAKAALSFRQLILSQVNQRVQTATLRRFFDPRIFPAIRERPSFLELKARPTTVVFWNVRGFSQVCAHLAGRPEQIRGFLDDHHRLMADTVFRHNGILDKWLGDGVMALFCGFGTGGTDFEARGAADAVTAALEARQRFEEIRVAWQAQWEAHFGATAAIGLGCGMHTGPCLVGNLGVEQHSQFTAVGPHTSFAARLKERAAPGQILCSEATVKKIGDGYVTTSLGVARNIKNIAGEQMIYQLDGKSRATSGGTPDAPA